MKNYVPLTFNMAAWICYANNRHYIRLRSLLALTDIKYRKDVVAGDLSSHILAGWPIYICVRCYKHLLTTLTF